MKKSLMAILIIAIIVVAYFLFYQSKDSVDTKNYIGNSTEECSRIKFMCIEGLERFDDESGCGCRAILE